MKKISKSESTTKDISQFKGWGENHQNKIKKTKISVKQHGTIWQIIVGIPKGDEGKKIS